MGETVPAPELPPRRPFRPLPEWAGAETRLVHGAERPERNAGAIVPPIYQTSTYRYPAEFSEARDGGGVYQYTRHENPSQEVAAELLRGLEGAEAARVFSSGMAAISTTLLALARPGEEIVALEELYGGTLELLSGLLPRYGVPVRLVSAEEAAAPEECLTEETRIVYLESPTNPTLRVHDLARWAVTADRVGAISVVDNTFATPLLQRPLELGIDVVVHSATKYLGGHSDLIGGAVAGPAALLERIRAAQVVLGGALDPFAAFLLARGLRTLSVRLDRQCATASELCRRLAAHPGVQRVCYPGRGGRDEEAVAARQMRGRGGMLAFTLAGGAPAVDRFLHRLELIQVAPSLGGVESLISVPRATSHRHLSPEELVRRGIDEGMVRLSVGLESAEDLWRDLASALGGP
jgi:cystathionine beta-lyase/cystathionine gamma-synthase